MYKFYGSMADNVKKLNFPHNVVDDVDKDVLRERWGDIVNIIHSVPDYNSVKEAMVKAHCKITVDDIGKDKTLFDNCVKYSPYMRHRLTLLRLKDMIVTE